MDKSNIIGAHRFFRDLEGRPLRKTMMRSQVRSTSAMRCEDIRTLMPKSRCVFRMSASISSRPAEQLQATIEQVAYLAEWSEGT